MGWWKVEQNEVGDTTLDIVRKFVVDFSKEYQEDLGRKPTLDELQYSLQLAFKVNLTDEIVSDFEELEIKQVVLKSAKRSKRQKAKVGDIFAFKVNHDVFCFGRMVSKVTGGFVVEIFNNFSKTPVFNPLKTDWLIRPIIVNQIMMFENRIYSLDFSDWQIIGYDENFDIGTKFNDVYFKYGHVNDWTVVDIYGKAVEHFIGDVDKIPRYASKDDFSVNEMIKEYLPQ